MKNHPIKYIKAYGLGLFLIQSLILILNKVNIFATVKKNLIVKKNKIVLDRLTNEYQDLIRQYNSVPLGVTKNSDKVWVFWWQGEHKMPELVKVCLESIKENLYDSSIVVLTKDNIDEFLPIPDYILDKFNKGIIGPAHFSDIVRTGLLKKYGGLWIDATIYLTGKINQKKLSEIKTVKFRCNDDTSISNGKWAVFFWGKMSNKLYDFMYDLYLDYWKKENIIIDYFLMDYMVKLAYLNFKDIREEFDNIPFNNEAIHELAALLNQKFNKKDFETLLSQNDIHKLSFKMELQEKMENQPTFWGVIKS